MNRFWMFTGAVCVAGAVMAQDQVPVEAPVEVVAVEEVAPVAPVETPAEVVVVEEVAPVEAPVEVVAVEEVAPVAVTEAPRGPVVTEEDNRPVAASDEDEGEGRVYIGAGVGGMRVHRSNQPKPGSALRSVQPYVILRLGYDFADSPWSLEGFGALGKTRTAKGANAATSHFGVGAEALYHFDRYAVIDPFLAGGLSFYGGDDAPMWQDTQRSHLFAQAGVGAFWHLTENFSLRGDVRYHVGLTNDFISFTTADISLVCFLGGESESSADTLQPLAEETKAIEAGAIAYGETSALGDKLKDVTPEGSVDEMKLELHIQYAKDTAIIQPSDYPALDELHRIISAAIEANPDVYVTIDGHADRQHGSDHAYNQRLSEARAKSVLTYLSHNGIPENKMKSAGHSFDMPKDPVNLDDGTPTNRRTEIVIRGVDEATRAKIRQQK